MIKEAFSVLSSDKLHTLAGVIYRPEGEPVGYFHVVHGMTDHIARYERFMSELTKEGYIVFGYDNLGHGYTAQSEEELGFIAETDGHERLAEDVRVFSDAVRAKYGALPYYLMGHSMGSFIARYAAEKYVKPEKLILMGTAGKNPVAAAALLLVSVTKAIKGSHYRSPLLDRLAFGSYNERFGGGTAADPSPWLSSLSEERARYYADPFCTFRFTVSAMGDLIRLIRLVNRPAWFTHLPKDRPILLVSGGDDPVGNYGVGVREVAQKLRESDHYTVCTLYPGARHEILNDAVYDKVKADILKFLKR